MTKQPLDIKDAINSLELAVHRNGGRAPFPPYYMRSHSSQGKGLGVGIVVDREKREDADYANMSLVHAQFEEAIRQHPKSGISITAIKDKMVPGEYVVDPSQTVDSFIITLAPEVTKKAFDQILTGIRQQFAIENKFSTLNMLPDTRNKDDHGTPWLDKTLTKKLRENISELKEVAKKIIPTARKKLPESLQEAITSYEAAVKLLSAELLSHSKSQEGLEAERNFTAIVDDGVKGTGYKSMAEVVQAKRGSGGDIGLMPVKTR
jgi:hypothetical protein